MPYSEIDEVRKQAGDPHPEDVSDDIILKNINAADVVITNSTQHVWEPADVSFPLAREISELLASSFIMDKFDDPKDEAEKNFEKGMMLLQLLVSEDEASTDVNVTSPEYKTFPLNPNMRIGRGRLRPLSHVEVVVDPDEIYEQEF